MLIGLVAQIERPFDGMHGFLDRLLDVLNGRLDRIGNVVDGTQYFVLERLDLLCQGRPSLLDLLPDLVRMLFGYFGFWIHSTFSFIVSAVWGGMTFTSLALVRPT